MLNRHPHTAKIVVSIEVENGTTTPTVTNEEVIFKGRYEPMGQNKNLDYSGKFYTNDIKNIVQKFADLGFFLPGFINNYSDERLKPFSFDGQKFIFEEKQLKIVQLFPYQTHFEIWLE